MRKPVLLIFTNALILIVVFMLLAQSLFVVQRLAQAQDVKGRVEVQRRGQDAFDLLAQNATVAVGDVVRTGTNGEVEFTWADGTRWRLAPNTTLTVKQAALNSVKHTEAARFRLDAGKVFLRVVKLLPPESRFEVETPTAVAAVRGTVFSVEVDKAQTEVEVWKGQVHLTTQDGKEGVVKTGEHAVAGNGTINVVTASVADSQAPTGMLRPDLDTEIQQIKEDRAVVRGNTEVGDRVSIDGKKVPVLGNGTFFKLVSLVPGHNEWDIQSTDVHGEVTRQCEAVEYDATTQKVENATCAAK